MAENNVGFDLSRGAGGLDPIERQYQTDRFRLELPEYSDRVDVRVLTEAFEKLNTDAAHLRLGWQENIFAGNPIADAAGIGGGIGIGTARIFAPPGLQALNVESSDAIYVFAGADVLSWTNMRWDDATGTWSVLDPLQRTSRIVQSQTYPSIGGWSYESSDLPGELVTVRRFSVDVDGNADALGAMMAGAYDVRTIMPEPATPQPSVLLGLIAGQTRFRSWNLADVLAGVQQYWNVNADNGLQTNPDRNVRIGPNGILHFIAPNGNRHHALRALATGGGVEFLRSDLAMVTLTISDTADITVPGVIVVGTATGAGHIYFEGSRQVMLRYRTDLGALETPYGNGMYAPYFHGSALIDAPTINASSSMTASGWIASPTHYIGPAPGAMYIQDAGGGAIRYMASGQHSFEGGVPLNCNGPINANGTAMTCARMVIAGWDVAQALNVGGSIRCSVNLYADGNVLYFAAGGSYVTWNGAQIATSHDMLVGGNGIIQMRNAGSTIQGDGASMFYKMTNIPGITKHNFQCTDGAWGDLLAATYQQASSLDFKADVQTFRDPLAVVLDPTLHGITYRDTSHFGQAKVGFVADYWLDVVPDLVATANNDGKKAIGMDYSAVGAITFEALKQYVQTTDPRLADLEARLAALEGAKAA